MLKKQRTHTDDYHTWSESSVYPSFTLFKFDTSTTTEFPLVYPSFPSNFAMGSETKSWELDTDTLGATEPLGEVVPPGEELILLSNNGIIAQAKDSL